MTPAQQEAKRLHRHRILERVPVVEFVRVPAAPWHTFTVHVNAPALTRFASDLDR